MWIWMCAESQGGGCLCWIGDVDMDVSSRRRNLCSLSLSLGVPQAEGRTGRGGMLFAGRTRYSAGWREGGR